MKAIIMAAMLVVTAFAGSAYAAGPFDGQYTGGSPWTGRQVCPATNATVTVADGKITGKYAASSYTFPVSGTVAPDGTVTGKWSVYPLTGKITGAHFEGSYTSQECHGARPISLNKGG